MRCSSSRLARASPPLIVPVCSPATSFATSRRQIARRSVPFLLPTQTRAFSQSVTRRLADEDGTFDPQSIERESDEVDVCIVGGGMCLQCSGV
jgi:electron-transferring-flavoprotein dehydrogenase